MSNYGKGHTDVTEVSFFLVTSQPHSKVRTNTPNSGSSDTARIFHQGNTVLKAKEWLYIHHENTNDVPRSVCVFSILIMHSSINQINYLLSRIFRHPHMRSICDGLHLLWMLYVIMLYEAKDKAIRQDYMLMPGACFEGTRRTQSHTTSVWTWHHLSPMCCKVKLCTAESSIFSSVFNLTQFSFAEYSLLAPEYAFHPSSRRIGCV